MLSSLNLSILIKNIKAMSYIILQDSLCQFKLEKLNNLKFELSICERNFDEAKYVNVSLSAIEALHYHLEKMIKDSKGN